MSTCPECHSKVKPIQFLSHYNACIRLERKGRLKKEREKLNVPNFEILNEGNLQMGKMNIFKEIVEERIKTPEKIRKRSKKPKKKRIVQAIEDTYNQEIINIEDEELDVQQNKRKKNKKKKEKKKKKDKKKDEENEISKKCHKCSMMIYKAEFREHLKQCQYKKCKFCKIYFPKFLLKEHIR